KNTKKLAADLASGDLALADVFADFRKQNPGKRILLIADQFEEAFSLVGDDKVRGRFIDILLAGFGKGGGPQPPHICLVMARRADFYGRVLGNASLAESVKGRLVPLGPMKREELREAIVKPAQNAGVSFEPGLVETLLDQVETEPGRLPPLQFALREMWGKQ